MIIATRVDKRPSFFKNCELNKKERYYRSKTTIVQMSSSYISTLNFISQQITIYLGSAIMIIGVIGGCLNLLVFFSLRTFRESSCAFYLIIMSVFNIGQLITGLLSQIMLTGFGIDWTQSSLFSCKWRPFCLQACMMISLTNVCLATIDQYWTTCSRPRWQQWCNIKLAHRLSAISVIIWLLHGIPYLIYMDHIVLTTTKTVICGHTNVIFRQYFIYVAVPIVYRFIPLTITFIFGLLAYRNVQQIAYRTVPLVRRQLDKQLTKMVLVQVFFTCFAILPLAIVNLFILFTDFTEDPLISAELGLINILTICLYYMYFAVSTKLN